MSAPISSVVLVSIAASTANPTVQGFNTELILSATAAWTERTRKYASIGAVGSDFATTTPEYKDAAKSFAQNPAPAFVKIGRANGAKPIQEWAITPVAIDSHKYAMNVDGHEVSFTSGVGTTVSLINIGLKAAIDAVSPAISGAGANLVTVSDQTTFMKIISNTAGVWHSVGTTIDGSPRNDPNLGVAQVQDEPSVGIYATELAAILAADADWYGVVNPFNSKKIVDVISAWCESNKRIFIAQTQDSACINTAKSGTDDVMESTQSTSLKHTGVIYSQDTADFADGAWMGRCLSAKPGSNTWWGKTLASVAFGNYSDTQRANIKAKGGNFYEDIASVGITSNGTAAGGSFLDFTIYVDYLTARLGERIFKALAQAEKMPYDDGGITIIGAEITGQLQDDADRGAILKNTWRVNLPKSSAIPVGGTDRLTRTLSLITFYAEYDDSIQAVQLNGVLVP